MSRNESIEDSVATATGGNMDRTDAFSKLDDTVTSTAAADSVNGDDTMTPVELHPHDERKLLRKIDLNVYPILFIIYMMSFLDRINISNAFIYGMGDALDLSGHHYNIALFMYFVTYIIFEIPSNIVIKYCRPSWYLGGLMLAWGIINMCMGFVNSYGALVALRLLLGACEAGVLPGIIYLTSMYYKRHEFQTRMSFFFSSTLVGGAFGGLLAFGIAKLDGRLGIAAWRWIFIIEGAITAGIAIAACFLIVDWPEQCKFLSTHEKAMLRARLAADVPSPDDFELRGSASPSAAETGIQSRSGKKAPAQMDELTPFSLRLILTDYKILLGSLMYMGCGTPGYGMTFFLPAILQNLGWTSASAQVHTIPVYAASAVAMCLVAWLSDRTKHRYGFIVISAIVATAGYGVLLASGHYNISASAQYGAVFLVAIGGFTMTPLPLAWLANNVSGHWKRSISSGMQVTIGNFAGIIGSNIFLTKEAPGYVTGYGTSLGLVWMGVLCATLMAGLMWWENKKRDNGDRDSRLIVASGASSFSQEKDGKKDWLGAWKWHEGDGTPAEEVDNLGDWHPAFRFTL